MTSPQQTDTGARIIGLDTVNMVVDALLVGLQAYGEIQRLQNAWKFCKLSGDVVPHDLRPIDPTGEATTITDFADALRLLRGLPRPPEGND
ncbi:MAG: hypothetical protein EOM91_24015 [Sphingobacteriia bacterium]|nr:hypothetical protein [Sphingobacteriia bacterium]